MTLDDAKKELKHALDVMLDDLDTKDDVKLCHQMLDDIKVGLNIFKPYRTDKKVSFFGSAQLEQSHPSCLQVKKFAHILENHGYMTITGGGEGIMCAANDGAGEAHSFAINIKLPEDKKQDANHVMRQSSRYFCCHYFFTRKFFFLKESHAVVLAEGGFGTLDETFETLTLLQTGRTRKVPVVFLEEPNGCFWAPFIEQWLPHLLSEGLIHPEDADLFLHTDDLDQARAYITGFSAFD
ncbi:MAG: LOG family protein [Mariprofundaceae bacterium]|nr:LOG family protein [Mariprofundaceae bacterium]